jgi:hypothetical protein
MKYIDKNEELLNFLVEDKNIISAAITRFDIILNN